MKFLTKIKKNFPPRVLSENFKLVEAASKGELPDVESIEYVAGDRIIGEWDKCALVPTDEIICKLRANSDVKKVERTLISLTDPVIHSFRFNRSGNVDSIVIVKIKLEVRKFLREIKKSPKKRLLKPPKSSEKMKRRGIPRTP